MTETATRRVRVTIEGDAHDVGSSGDCIRVEYGPHRSAMLIVGGNVQVEDVTQERTWTNGDVVQSNISGKAYARMEHDAWQAGFTDEDMSRHVAFEMYTVLRYQAGEQ